MGLFRKLQKKPTLFLSTTGMRLDRFEQLMPEFEKAYRDLEVQRKSRVVKTGEERQRQPGGGAQFSTELTERLLMLLLYYRLYLTQEFMTLLFDVESKATISRAIGQMRPIFEAVLPVPERARETVLALAEKETQRRRIGNIKDFLEAYPELSILIDGTEQPKQRPQDKQKRKDDYSGKKKRHTLKQIITATSKGIILDQSPSVGGRCHDFQAFKAHVADGAAGRAMLEQFRALRVVVTTDSGFTGIDKLSLPCATRIVERARRGHPLTPEQKILNRVRSRERIQVEHTIGRRKKYRIASSVYRNADQHYDAAMNVVGGLVNLRAYDRIACQTGIDLLGVAI
jgi:hypothetical protein